MNKSLYEKFELRRLTVENYETEVKQFVADYYTQGDVLALLSGATPEDERGIYVYRAYEALTYNASFGFYEKSSKKLVAIKLNLLHDNKDSTVTSMLTGNPDVQLSQLAKTIIRFIDQFVGDIYTDLGTNRYMELGMTCVHKNYVRMGLATELGKQSAILAKEMGYNNLMSFATSSFTQRSNDKCGFTFLREVCYKDYVDEVTQTKPFYNEHSEHTHARLYYKRV